MKNLSAAQAGALRALQRLTVRAPRPCACDAAGAPTPETAHALQAAMDKTLARHRAVGAVIALVRGGVPWAVLSYGNARMRPDVPARPDTLFRVASVSKLVFTFGILRLAEEGVLALDADIGDTLGWAVRNPAFPDVPVTLRQLLTHTAGLRDAPQYDHAGIAGGMGLREMLSPPNSAVNFAPVRPGAVFSYSNFGAGIVGSLAEAATGERFDDLMQRLLFAPLGMTASFAPQHLLPQADRLAIGYRVRRLRAPVTAYDAPALAAAPRAPRDPDRDFMIAPGRLQMTVPDMARLARLLLSDGAVDGVRILQPASMAAMRARQSAVGSVGGDAGRGLNVALCPRVLGPALAIGHQGVAYGMHSALWADPTTGDAVALAVNGAWLDAVGRQVHCGWALASLGFEALRASRLP